MTTVGIGDPSSETEGVFFRAKSNQTLMRLNAGQNPGSRQVRPEHSDNRTREEVSDAVKSTGSERIR